jgi:hypothetical protein
VRRFHEALLDRHDEDVRTPASANVVDHLPSGTLGRPAIDYDQGNLKVSVRKDRL